jgi:hypothetical protein
MPKKQAWQSEIDRQGAEWRKWQDHWRTYQRVCHYSVERDAAVQALEGEGRIVDPLPNLEWIRDGVEAQVAGDRHWYTPDMIAGGYEARRKEELVAELVAEIARWRELASAFLRSRRGTETVDEWITRHCRASEEW